MTTLTLTMLTGLCTGTLFGFLLQRGAVARFNTIVGQFLLKDFTVLKVMLTAIIVGGITIYALVAGEFIAALPCKSSSIIGSALGGVIFGVGMAILGYCPGTALAALGQGSFDAFFGILGMFAGALFFERMYVLLKIYVLTDTPSTLTLVQLFHVSPWLLFAALFAITIVLIKILKKYQL